MKRRERFGALLIVILLVASGCGNPSEQAAPDGERTVDVVMRDNFTYDPAEIEVTAGEVVKFQVTNEGAMVHEFLIGDQAQQKKFEEEMEKGGHEAHGESVPGVSVEAGKTESFVFEFPSEPKELSFGCHQPGHYDAGMRGVFKFRVA